MSNSESNKLPRIFFTTAKPKSAHNRPLEYLEGCRLADWQITARAAVAGASNPLVPTQSRWLWLSNQ